MVVFLHLFLHNPILKMLIAISCRIISKNVMGFLGGWVVKPTAGAYVLLYADKDRWYPQLIAVRRTLLDSR